MNETNNIIMALIVLSVLLIPSIALDYTSNIQKEELFNLSENNYNYLYYETTYINQTRIENQLYGDGLGEFIGDGNNSDIVGIDEVDGNTFNVEYGHLQYIGNDTYLFNTTDFTYKDYYLIAVNLSTHNLTNYDFICLETSNPMDISQCWIFYTISAYSKFTITFQTVEQYPPTTKSIGIINANNKITITTVCVDDILYIKYKPEINGNLDCTFKLSTLNPKNESVFTIDDTTMYYIIVTGDICISTFVLFLITQPIDLIYNDRKNKWRK